jgi:hypothetical protein
MQETMSFHDKLVNLNKVRDLKAAGRLEEARALNLSIPLPPWLAKVFVEITSAEHVRNSGYNLSEAEAEFGPNWLDT